ncbi:putative reverse transcriptase domain-containing protein [Tanacetum coccineum]
MPPTRRTTRTTPATTTTPTTTVTNAQLQALIDQGVVAALAERNASRSRRAILAMVQEPLRRQVPTQRECTYTDFLKCQPINFKGTEGVVGLTQWAEKMESVFLISNCAITSQVKYASCTLQGSALTWWNSHVRAVGQDVAYTMPWTALKRMITDKYCPRGEIKKLESEYWNLKVRGPRSLQSDCQELKNGNPRKSGWNGNAVLLIKNAEEQVEGKQLEEEPSSLRLSRVDKAEVVTRQRRAYCDGFNKRTNKALQGFGLSYYYRLDLPQRILELRMRQRKPNKPQSDRRRSDRQKSYVKVRRKPLEFQVGDRVMLKLSRVRSTFHVSSLKKCLFDEPLVVPLDEIHIDDKLRFIGEPVEIMDREVKQLKQRRIPIIKVRWNCRRGPEFTWEREDQF